MINIYSCINYDGNWFFIPTCNWSESTWQMQSRKEGYSVLTKKGSKLGGNYQSTNQEMFSVHIHIPFSYHILKKDRKRNRKSNIIYAWWTKTRVSHGEKEALFTPMALKMEQHLAYNILYIKLNSNYSIYKFICLWLNIIKPLDMNKSENCIHLISKKDRWIMTRIVFFGHSCSKNMQEEKLKLFCAYEEKKDTQFLEHRKI